jgi:hypothetical protein
VSSAIDALEPNPIDRVLSELAALAARNRRGEDLRLPQVTLHLRSGRDLRGAVLAIGRDGAVLFQASEADATHLSASSIEALTRHDVAGASRPPDVSKDAPTRLELRRRASQLSPEAVIAEGDPDDDGRRALDALLGELETTLKEITSDPLGREAIAEKIQRIEVRLGSTAAASLTGGTLTLTTTVRWPSRLFGADLRARIESLL